MLFSLSAETVAPVEQPERPLDRLLRLMDEAVDRGDFSSRADILRRAGLSSGYLGELRQRDDAAKERGAPPADMLAPTLRALASTLGITVSELSGAEEPPPDDDVDPNRSWAVLAARALLFPETAIRIVQAEPPGGSRWYWFRRIEVESERLAPTSGGDRGR
jgi:Arc/MetJ-type ribon-helix-helix transcriptional regulator